MYKKCAQLLGNGFNATYAVYLLLAHTFQPPEGVRPRWTRRPAKLPTKTINLKCMAIITIELKIIRRQTFIIKY